MSARKSFLLRLPPDLHTALEKWAADDLRSVNGQIEYLLARAAKEAGRAPRPGRGGDESTGAGQAPTEES